MPTGGKLTFEAFNIAPGDPELPAELEVGRAYVAVTVSDTGQGMPADVVERAFEPFFTTQGTWRGSGLGLS